MKKRLFIVLLLFVALTAGASEVLREHRAIWMSPLLNYTWPTTALKSETQTKTLDSALDRLVEQGINVLYYHVRPNCDAMYASSYEPWSSKAGGSRGTAPAFDPFGYLVKAAHARGIEVYAWVNPYRYSNNGFYGAGERNYETTHPDWLIVDGKSIILNPGIPAVQDQIEAIISEIATNYDIDGMLFDDYFYLSGTPESADAEQFAACTAAGFTGSLAEYRRANVNETVRRSYEAVKKARPYAVFAMGPAGKISPDNIRDYGLEPGPCGDMNYNTLFADPILWLSKGWLDFLSPQLYWLEDFDKLSSWYAKAVPHLGRQFYPSVDLNRTSNGAEYIRQIEYTRSLQRANQSGIVFFDYGTYYNYRDFSTGVATRLGDMLMQEVFHATAPVPVRYWEATPGTPEELIVNYDAASGTLTWNAQSDARYRRYVVYKYEDTTIGEKPRVVAVRYDESYTLPDGDDDYQRYAVAVYDRYGYVYTPAFEFPTYVDCCEGPVKAGINGDYESAGTIEPADLFDFTWDYTAGRALIEVSETPDFSKLLGVNESYDGRISSADVANFEAGKTYYWRVTPYDPPQYKKQSAVMSFTASRVAITSARDGLGLTPTFTWTPCTEGSLYTFELSKTEAFSDGAIVASYQGADCSYTIPAKTLVTGRKYYARVTACRGTATSVSEKAVVYTDDCSDYAAPALVKPAVDGATVHCNEAIVVDDYDGLCQVVVEICGTTAFAARSSYIANLTDYGTATRNLGEVKITSKPLVDGHTYYVRVKGQYNLKAASSAQNTEYGPIRSFVYSSEAGIDIPEADYADPYITGTTLHAPAGILSFGVYGIDGRRMAVSAAKGATECSLGDLAPGIYIVKVNNLTIKWVK